MAAFMYAHGNKHRGIIGEWESRRGTEMRDVVRVQEWEGGDVRRRRKVGVEIHGWRWVLIVLWYRAEWCRCGNSCEGGS